MAEPTAVGHMHAAEARCECCTGACRACAVAGASQPDLACGLERGAAADGVPRVAQLTGEPASDELVIVPPGRLYIISAAQRDRNTRHRREGVTGRRGHRRTGSRRHQGGGRISRGPAVPGWAVGWGGAAGAAVGADQKARQRSRLVAHPLAFAGQSAPDGTHEGAHRSSACGWLSSDELFLPPSPAFPALVVPPGAPRKGAPPPATAS